MSSDPNSPTYYFPLVIAYFLVMIFLYVIISILKSLKGHHHHEKSIHLKKSKLLSESNNESVILNESAISNHLNEFDRRNKNMLRKKYLIGYLLTKGSMWAKSPYLFTLFVQIHGFSISEIGILYIVDGVSALILGPILGNLADIFGRKMFCMIYCVTTVVNLVMRCTGNREMAYLAQVLTGLGAGLINTSLESWVNCETRTEFNSMKIDQKKIDQSINLFLKKLFKDQSIYDSVSSIVISVICSIVYNIYGIFAPILVSIILASSAFFVMMFTWNENKPNEEAKDNMMSSVSEAFLELKKSEVVCVGVIESFFQAVMALFLFAWTPILTATAGSQINVGMIFVCFVLSIINCTMVYELVSIQIGVESFYSLTVFFFLESSIFVLIYIYDNFMFRLIMLSLINGCMGFFNPLNSVVKSKILVEKYRALLMNLFRIPLNIYVIIVLLFLKYLDPLKICLVSAGMIIISFSVSFFLAVKAKSVKN